MLSLKKICLQALSRASRAGNTAVLGPQLFIPEIYSMFIKQLGIDADGGSECCYLTTERDFYLLYRVYICITKYFNININDKFTDKMRDLIDYDDDSYSDYLIPLIDEYDSDNIPIAPLTDLLYDKYHIRNIMSNAKCINELIKYQYGYRFIENASMFVYDLPPLLIILGLFFKRLIGPKYINRWDIKCARDVIF
jgi:hypothetical protein